MLEGSDRRALARGRRIVSDGGLLPEGLSGPILRSWQRCIDRGLDLFGRPTAEPLTARELSRVIERNERLRAAARPELEALREALATAAPRLDAIRFVCSQDIAAR